MIYLDFGSFLSTRFYKLCVVVCYSSAVFTGRPAYTKRNTEHGSPDGSLNNAVFIRHSTNSPPHLSKCVCCLIEHNNVCVNVGGICVCICIGIYAVITLVVV